MVPVGWCLVFLSAYTGDPLKIFLQVFDLEMGLLLYNVQKFVKICQHPNDGINTLAIF
jgi:hypothetical protein